MGRPAGFDRREVVARAVDAFWKHGYGAVSTNDLTNQLGIARSSFYNTFSSKSRLLQEAVALYAQNQGAAIRSAKGESNVLQCLREMLLVIANGNDGGRGCLLVNTAVEVGRHDPEIAQAAHAGFEAMRAMFAELIGLGQAAGEIASNVDASERALAIVASVAGIRVLACSGYAATDVSRYVDDLLASMAA